MGLYLGGDLGTSGLKLSLLDDRRNLVRELTVSYPLLLPKPGFSEQNPADWIAALKKGIGEILSKEEKKDLKAIALDGQMHGLVLLDEKGNVLRNAILWNDERSTKEVDYLNSEIGMDTLLEKTNNVAFTGFTLPKLLWVKNNERDIFDKARMMLLPKDYLNFFLTGNCVSEPSDAVGTLLYDQNKNEWSKEMADLVPFPLDYLPRLVPSSSVIGTIKEEVAKELGLPKTVKVYAGAGDNAAAALGIGAIKPGECNISLGTSGTIFAISEKPFKHSIGAIHGFMTATGGYGALSCMLSAASSLKWLQENILLSDDFNGEQAKIKEENLGHNSVYFLPYLNGERSPINDPHARGAFLGLSLTSKREDLVQAVMEGVAFALKDSLLEMEKQGIEVKESYLTGGGSKSPLWRKILANVLGIDLLISPAAERGPSYGMALLAATGEGVYDNLEETKVDLSAITKIRPDPHLQELYEKQYEEYKRFYPALKQTEEGK